MSEKKVILRAENLTKRYGDKEVLKNASFSIREGELKILIGPSGGGKSTLLQCINFLVRPEAGRVWLDGREVLYHRKRELYAYRQKVGMIFQDFNLFDHLTAVGNVEIALIHVRGMDREEARTRASSELERVGLREHMEKYPAQLSGGQKQRVSIARALAMDPVVMLLDEPTSALDPELISEVLSVIRDLRANGMTMIMSTHQIGFAGELADEILFMEDGVIVETGSPKKLFSQAECQRTREFFLKIVEIYGESR
ncbi:MAG TPA: amino acid ABC transporter ATP-binding protein [Syntrophales bacterium]|nr:amino acid ABC transporter ATP-binding protein [Syntrophales bacterium]HQB29826.1 amino acid ABC transporter ATP-binding protein [Syntrophales bacterium]HQN78305.1 amino acid ABC transporter ATP-binding protein [Syntrophales bacterium]HQQ27190.1 amino acid ABC transporter ATP-binding protein [Syntrophales bacterium]